MFAITGVTGKVGGAVARSLLAQGHKVRAVVRDAEKGRSWSAQGCDIGIASVEDAVGLTKAFHGAEGVFLMTPPTSILNPDFLKRTRRLRPFGMPSKLPGRGRSCFSPRLEPMLRNPTF
jgi:uncharacterized protein YbjT (DUF2867 family)